MTKAPKPKFETHRIPFEETATDWQAAAAALRAGDKTPVCAMLVNLDLPHRRLVPLFETVLADERLCRERFAAYELGEFEALQNELESLASWQTSSQSEAAALAKRRSELPNLISAATNRRELRHQAEVHQHAIEQAFPELFTGESVEPRRTWLDFPAATAAKLKELDIQYHRGETWRDCLREAEQHKQERRKLRVVSATGGFERKESSL